MQARIFGSRCRPPSVTAYMGTGCSSTKRWAAPAPAAAAAPARLAASDGKARNAQALQRQLAGRAGVVGAPLQPSARDHPQAGPSMMNGQRLSIGAPLLADQQVPRQVVDLLAASVGFSRTTAWRRARAHACRSAWRSPCLVGMVPLRIAMSTPSRTMSTRRSSDLELHAQPRVARRQSFKLGTSR
jgi:hypothetical protein